MNNYNKLRDNSCADSGMVCSLICSVGLCFIGDGPFKSLLFLSMSPIASKHSAFPLTKVSASKLSMHYPPKRRFFNEVNQRLPYWNCFVSQAMFIWYHPLWLKIGRKEKIVKKKLSGNYLDKITWTNDVTKMLPGCWVVFKMVAKIFEFWASFELRKTCTLTRGWNFGVWLDMHVLQGFY